MAHLLQEDSRPVWPGSWRRPVAGWPKAWADRSVKPGYEGYWRQVGLGGSRGRPSGPAGGRAGSPARSAARSMATRARALLPRSRGTGGVFARYESHEGADAGAGEPARTRRLWCCASTVSSRRCGYFPNWGAAAVICCHACPRSAPWSCSAVTANRPWTTPRLSAGFGDCTSVAEVGDGSVYAAWPDTRSGKQEVWAVSTTASSTFVTSRNLDVASGAEVSGPRAGAIGGAHRERRVGRAVERGRAEVGRVPGRPEPGPLWGRGHRVGPDSTAASRARWRAGRTCFA